MIYLDNAATTFPKPRPTLDRMVEIYARTGVSSGRGSYDMAAEAEERIQRAREKVARFFGAAPSDQVVFANNATDALNLLLQGLLRPKDHVVSTRLEHNSVLRPLYHLKQQGLIEIDLVPFNNAGFVASEQVAGMMRPNTRLVVMTHASNVLGTVQPVSAIGRICKERGIPLVIDAAQSAGKISIHMAAWGVSALAFTGHKSLYGPTGIGGLVFDPALNIEATRFGGTGVDSASLAQTPSLPHRLESGTLNLMGIIGLCEGLDFVMEKGIEAVRRREMDLLRMLRDGMRQLDGLVDIHCAEDLTDHVAVLMANIKGMDPEDVGAILDADFKIAVRVGLHCAPLVHEDLGTSPRGGVRFSLGCFNRKGDIQSAIEAVTRIAKGRKRG